MRDKKTIVIALAIAIEICLASFALANIAEAVLVHEVFVFKALANNPTELLGILVPVAATISVAIAIIGVTIAKTDYKKFLKI